MMYLAKCQIMSVNTHTLDLYRFYGIILIIVLVLMAIQCVSRKELLAILLLSCFVLVLLQVIKLRSSLPSPLTYSPTLGAYSPVKYEDGQGEKLTPNVSTSLTQKDEHKETRQNQLTQDAIDGIKKFVLFVGYERSGHSIVGSLMDAHPHVVIAHEFYLFRKFDKLDKVTNGTWRENLFQSLYGKNSRRLVRSSSGKGYTLKVEGLWEGTYDDHIEVIGDKSGGSTTKSYLSDKQASRRILRS